MSCMNSFPAAGPMTPPGRGWRSCAPFWTIPGCSGGVSNVIPMEDAEDNPFRLEIYTEERIPAASFELGSDGLLYAEKLRFRPLNADLRAALEPLAEQWEQEHKNGGDG